MSDINIDDIDEWAEHIKEIKSNIRPTDKVEYLSVSGSWCSLAFFNGEFMYPSKYRIKPRTIRIGEYDVPEPIREAPEVGSVYFISDPTRERFVCAYMWKNDAIDGRYLSRNIAHSTQEAAELHAKALISLTTKKD